MITSRTNSSIAMIKKLIADKKYRMAMGKYCIEGVRLLSDAIKYHKHINSIFVAQSRVDKLPPNLPCEYTVVADSVLDSVCDTVNSQGVVTVLDITTASISSTGKVLVLEKLQDPGNVGTLMRSAAAFGYNTVVAIGCVDIYSPKVIRSAMSAHFTVNTITIDSIDNLAECVGNRQLYVADMGGVDVSTVSVGSDVALLVGNEGNGVSSRALALADAVVSLPMSNELESLNVAIAGSILMYTL